MSEGSNVLNDPQSADVTLIVGREGTTMKAHASVSKTALTIDAFADVNHQIELSCARIPRSSAQCSPPGNGKSLSQKRFDYQHYQRHVFGRL